MGRYFNVCQKCTSDRHPGCHGSCSRYLDERKEYDRVMARVAQAKRVGYSQKTDGIVRAERKGGRVK